MNEDWDRGNCQAEVGSRGSPERTNGNREHGTVRLDVRGAVEENRGIKYVGTELELEPGTQGERTARGHTEEKKRRKIKMLGQHNI